MENFSFFDVHRNKIGFSVFYCIYTHINYIYYGQPFIYVLMNYCLIVALVTYLHDMSLDYCYLPPSDNDGFSSPDDLVVVEDSSAWFALEPYVQYYNRDLTYNTRNRIMRMSHYQKFLCRGRHNQIGSSHGEVTESDDVEPDVGMVVIDADPNNIIQNINNLDVALVVQHAIGAEECFICTAHLTRYRAGQPPLATDKFRFHRDNRHFTCFQCACVLFHREWRNAGRSNVGIHCPVCRTMTFSSFELMNPDLVDRNLHRHFVPFVRPPRPVPVRPDPLPRVEQAAPFVEPEVGVPAAVPHVANAALDAGREAIILDLVIPPQRHDEALDAAFDRDLPDDPEPPPDPEEGVILYTTQNKFDILTSTINWKIVMLLIAIFIAGDPVVREGFMAIVYTYVAALFGFGSYIAMTIRDFLAPELNYIEGALVVYRGVRDAAWYLRAAYLAAVSFCVALAHIYMNSTSSLIIRYITYYAWEGRWVWCFSYSFYVFWCVVQQHFAVNGAEYVLTQSQIYGWPILLSRVVSIPGYNGFIRIKINRAIVDRVLIRRAASANSTGLARFIVNDVFTDEEAYLYSTQYKHTLSMYIYQSIMFMRAAEPAYALPTNQTGVGNLRW